MELTISIVNWNVKEYLEKCLDSIFKYSNAIDFKVIVVDNASKDGSINMLKEKFPRVDIIENNENLGYDCAHNLVIPISKGKYILFLNPDTEMLPDTLSGTLRFMNAHPEAGACACREIPTKEDTSEVMVLTKLRRVLWPFYKGIHRRFPNRLTAHFCMNFIARTTTLSKEKYIFTEQLALEGGFLLVRKDSLEQAGGFNPKFFYGREGTELTRRIRGLGWKLYRIPSVKIVHYGNRSCSQMDDYEFMNLLNDWQRRRS